ncbi:hypothetical protein BJ741DRAFT_612596 [Chytriomyces cf. hyalinus JEL632]|nr:hypothetical protein BJ741DRAFT_612596 [Chytriomyces cf. hyalinus JEL632]
MKSSSSTTEAELRPIRFARCLDSACCGAQTKPLTAHRSLSFVIDPGCLRPSQQPTPSHLPPSRCRRPSVPSQSVYSSMIVSSLLPDIGHPQPLSIHSGARSVFESTPSSSAPAKRKRGSNLNAKYNDMHNQMVQLANMIDAKKENATPSSNRIHYKPLAPPSSAISSSPSIYENTRMHQDAGLFYNDKKLGSHGGRFNFNRDSLSYVDNSPSTRRAAPLNPVAAYSSVNTSRLTKKLRVNDSSQESEEVKPKFSVLSSSNNPFEVNLHTHTYKPPVPPRPATSIPKTQGFIYESENHLVLDD